MIKTLYLILIKSALKIHNYSYKIASFLVKKIEKNQLHPKHRLTNYHKFFLDNIESNDTVLDIGCGEGELTYDLAKKAKNITGIDFCEKSIRTAQDNYSAPNIEYILGDVLEYFPERKFEVAVLSNVLEHIEDRVEFFKKTGNLVSKILIRVPMINRDWITLYKKELGLEWRLHNEHFIEYTLGRLKKK